MLNTKWKIAPLPYEHINLLHINETAHNRPSKKKWLWLNIKKAFIWWYCYRFFFLLTLSTLVSFFHTHTHTHSLFVWLYVIPFIKFWSFFEILHTYTIHTYSLRHSQDIHWFAYVCMCTSTHVFRDKTISRRDCHRWSEQRALAFRRLRTHKVNDSLNAFRSSAAANVLLIVSRGQCDDI